MRGKFFVAVLVLVAVIGGIIYAEPSQDTIGREDYSDLTDIQKAELSSIWEKMQGLREKMMDKMVEFGVISPERAQWVKEGQRLQQEEGDEFPAGYGYCHGPRARRMHHRHMMRGNWGI